METFQSTLRHWIALGVSLGALNGCSSVRHEFTGPIQWRAEWDTRLQTRFESGCLMKPSYSMPDSIIKTMAPLILVEQPRKAESIGGSASVWPEILYTFQSTTTIRGNLHQVLGYAWFCEDGESEGSRCLGMRVILDQEGRPLVWQAIDTENPPGALFVAVSLENAARSAFGSPLVERRFAIETAIAAHPEILVTRVIDDGPIPMGPTIYVASHPTRITTILCRCMPAQVENVPITADYNWAPLETAPQQVKTAIQEAEVNFSSALRWPQRF